MVGPEASGGDRAPGRSCWPGRGKKTGANGTRLPRGSNQASTIRRTAEARYARDCSAASRRRTVGRRARDPHQRAQAAVRGTAPGDEAWWGAREGWRRGRSERSVAQDATRAKHIPNLRDGVGTSLDKGEELDALSRLPRDRQKALIADARTGKKVSAKPEAKRFIWTAAESSGADVAK
jgi:hypothetical protein